MNYNHNASPPTTTATSLHLVQSTSGRRLRRAVSPTASTGSTSGTAADLLERIEVLEKQNQESADAIAALTSLLNQRSTPPPERRRIGQDRNMCKFIRQHSKDNFGNMNELIDTVYEWNNQRNNINKSSIADTFIPSIRRRLTNRKHYLSRRAREEKVSAEDRAQKNKGIMLLGRKKRKLEKRLQAFEKHKDDDIFFSAQPPIEAVLSLEYMSDDEDDMELMIDGKPLRWITQRPSWRSNELNRFFEQLDALCPLSGRSVPRSIRIKEIPAPIGLTLWAYASHSTSNSN